MMRRARVKKRIGFDFVTKEATALLVFIQVLQSRSTPWMNDYSTVGATELTRKARVHGQSR